LSNSDLSKIVWLAFIIVVLAAVMLGIVIGSNLKPSTTPVLSTIKPADITLVVQGGSTLGPDGNLHDAFVPCNFTVYAGQEVNLTVVNYDSAEHSFTSPTLNVNFLIPPSTTNGVPLVSNFQFSESTAGVYRWYCSIPCDTDAGGWAMMTGSDGQPGQIGFMGGFVTVLQG
jgi:uncharacterized cupredoxin-like copper-binding protein